MVIRYVSIDSTPSVPSSHTPDLTHANHDTSSKDFENDSTTSVPSDGTPALTHANHDTSSDTFSESRENNFTTSVPSDGIPNSTHANPRTSAEENGGKVTLLYFANPESSADLKPLEYGHDTENSHVIKPIIRLHSCEIEDRTKGASLRSRTSARLFDEEMTRTRPARDTDKLVTDETSEALERFPKGSTLVESVLTPWTQEFLSKGPIEVEQAIKRRYDAYPAKDNFKIDFAHNREHYLNMIGPVSEDTFDKFPLTLTMRNYKRDVLREWKDVPVDDPSSVTQSKTGPRLVPVEFFRYDASPTSGAPRPNPTTCTYAVESVTRGAQGSKERYAQVHL